MAWRPYVKFNAAHYVVILNPFCKRPPTNPNMGENRSKLPENMFVDVTHSQISYLEAILGNYLMVLRLPNQPGDKPLIQHLHVGSTAEPNFELYETPADQKVATVTNIAFLKFQSRPEMIDYLKAAVAATFSIFGPREIAKLVNQCHGKSDAELETMMKVQQKEGGHPSKVYDLGHSNVTGKQAVDAFKVFQKFIMQEISKQCDQNNSEWKDLTLPTDQTPSGLKEMVDNLLAASPVS